MFVFLLSAGGLIALPMTVVSADSGVMLGNRIMEVGIGVPIMILRDGLPPVVLTRYCHHHEVCLELLHLWGYSRISF
ncbi:hypothetical protein PR202_ga07647 [Eleusine coracana subsp. coracana]|uniref:Uncharacterized protein n=1 Tax=Eleusine coracana subsp. coracana TaxID=191504 RepID=A0AAV5C043_ELECO|nr:hypothetical protein PR202_ga07647 [Eleusine coracana subsp. coracana]